MYITTKVGNHNFEFNELTFLYFYLLFIFSGTIFIICISRKQNHYYTLIPSFDIDSDRDTSKDDEFSGSTIISNDTNDTNDDINDEYF
jgi:hypothetical protein